jgi:hypothetical protein
MWLLHFVCKQTHMAPKNDNWGSMGVLLNEGGGYVVEFSMKKKNSGQDGVLLVDLGMVSPCRWIYLQPWPPYIYFILGRNTTTLYIKIVHNVNNNKLNVVVKLYLQVQRLTLFSKFLSVSPRPLGKIKWDGTYVTYWLFCQSRICTVSTTLREYFIPQICFDHLTIKTHTVLHYVKMKIDNLY